MTNPPTPSVLAALAQVIEERRASTADASYTKSLLDKGAAHCAKKFGEEAVEFALAVAAEGDDAVQAEAADVLYHLLVALAARGVAIADVEQVLAARMGVSGHAEKAARSADGAA
ncbi:MAG: phosphoribosyl-ATP diphosphatase [Pseudomonadota bacterium]